jgi:hypothetical protein
MFPGWVILSMALRWHLFFHVFPLPQPFERGRKEGRTEKRMDGMGCM